MKAPVGAIVSIYFDAGDTEVGPVDVIETSRTKRHYWVLAAKRQTKGKHAGRYHLQCLVLGDDWATVVGTDPRIHVLHWYKR